MKNLKTIALGLGLAALSACSTVDRVVDDVKFMDWPSGLGSSSSSENLLDGSCPKAEVVPELGTLSEFTDPAHPGAQNLVSYARISAVQSKCSYASQSVTVDLKLSFEGNLGPAGRKNGGKPFFAYPFFVAVTSPTGMILAKEVFAANMNYEPGQDQQVYHESMRQIIPIPGKDVGKNYKVLAGFQLMPEQLGYNRAVIKAEAEARKAQEAATKKAAEAAKDHNGAIVVPDTTVPGAQVAPVEAAPASQQLNGPINIAPIRK